LKCGTREGWRRPRGIDLVRDERVKEGKNTPQTIKGRKAK
jgi:hypothetical protein